jgi:hypothetical protein
MLGFFVFSSRSEQLDDGLRRPVNVDIRLLPCDGLDLSLDNSLYDVLAFVIQPTI